MSFFSQVKSKSTLSTTLLVAGCCIGAGMVGLPVVSQLAGFMPSTLAMLFVYVFTTFTGLLLLEATLYFQHEVNLTTIVEDAFGRIGKLITLGLFLFLFYCLFVAYYDACGELFSELLSTIFSHPVSKLTGTLTSLVLVGSFTYAGLKITNSFNRALLIGLVLSYILLVLIGLPKVSLTNLTQTNPSAAIVTIPILLICFGYQNLVPSLTFHLNKNVNALRFCIIIGNLIPFFIYLLWNFVILGIIDKSDVSNTASADMVTDLLQGGVHSELVVFLIKSFSFFAILTSFLPNAISFVDFLKDGLPIKSKQLAKHNLVYLALVFLPPLFFSFLYPHLFLEALSFAGGFIDILLFGVLPAAVVLMERYKRRKTVPYQVIGGTITPIVIILISLGILLIKYH